MFKPSSFPKPPGARQSSTIDVSYSDVIANLAAVALPIQANDPRQAAAAGSRPSAANDRRQAAAAGSGPNAANDPRQAGAAGSRPSAANDLRHGLRTKLCATLVQTAQQNAAASSTQVAVARSNVSSVVLQDVTAAGKGVLVSRSAKPLLERINLAEAVLPHLGETPEERKTALAMYKILQMDGGEHHGKIVAAEFVAKVTDKRADNTSAKIKKIIKKWPELFPSHTEILSGQGHVSFSTI